MHAEIIFLERSKTEGVAQSALPADRL